MGDPFDKATAKAPPVLGEGCLSRYDPEALSEEDGADFSEAPTLLEEPAPAPDASVIPE